MCVRQSPVATASALSPPVAEAVEYSAQFTCDEMPELLGSFEEDWACWSDKVSPVTIPLISTEDPRPVAVA